VAETLLWAYGVVPAAAAPPDVPGIAGRPVERLNHDGLAALVTAVPAERFTGAALQERLEDLDELEALARGHEAVLDAVLAAGDLVPFRMCTIYRSPDTVRHMLATEAERLKRALDRLRGKAEWGVKAFVRAPAAAQAAGRPSSGAEYLARRSAERRQAALEDDALVAAAAGVHARLAQGASAAVLAAPQDRRLHGRDTEMMLNASYLVERERAGDFAGLVESLDADGLALELTGPWPAYHFVTEQ
jgi:Gas vesicle synthesis protein GvpL/GvpF